MDTRQIYKEAIVVEQKKISTRNKSTALPHIPLNLQKHSFLSHVKRQNTTNHNRQSPTLLQHRRLELRRIRLHGNFQRILQNRRNPKNRNRIWWWNCQNRQHLRSSKRRHHGLKPHVRKNKPTNTLHKNPTPNPPIPKPNRRPIRQHTLHTANRMPTHKPTRNKKIPRRKHKGKPMHPTHTKSNGNIPTNGRKQQTNLTVSHAYNTEGIKYPFHQTMSLFIR